MRIINGVVYLEPGETLGAGKKAKRKDSTGLMFMKDCAWSKRVNQLRNQGKIKGR